MYKCERKGNRSSFVCLDIGLSYKATVYQTNPDEVLLIVETLLSAVNKKLEKIKDEINDL